MIVVHGLPVMETGLLSWVNAVGDVNEIYRVTKEASDFLEMLEKRLDLR